MSMDCSAYPLGCNMASEVAARRTNWRVAHTLSLCTSNPRHQKQHKSSLTTIINMIDNLFQPRACICASYPHNWSPILRACTSCTALATCNHSTTVVTWSSNAFQVYVTTNLYQHKCKYQHNAKIGPEQCSAITITLNR